jgi:alkylation response protein AidB-like acyl-CoA dehydrogenase
MSAYKAPLRDMQFVLNELLNSEAHYAAVDSPESLTPDLLSAILDGIAQFAEEQLEPINRSGDEEGCHWSSEGVTTPSGFKEAYQQYVAGGWTSLSSDPEFGGQGLPTSVGFLVDEITGSANWSWAMYPGLSKAATRLLTDQGSDLQKSQFLGQLVSGEWTGTMCLTEPHSGSDLGLLRTRAEPQDDGSYLITGTKIFISAGEHDLTDNIVHMVLARAAGAPAGTQGISLFIVPKFDIDADGAITERNAVHCGSIEHKMGIRASVTAVLNFDGARGYLVGEETRGLNQMFIMMNAARVGTAIQGLSVAESALQRAVAYATERLQMRSLSGAKNPDGPADPIIVHPDVRRMLLTQKAFAEGNRAFLYWLLQQVDNSESADTELRERAEWCLELLTPIAKAFVTETGLECAHLALQCFGGHGYIREHGVEQIVRDARISTVYEGTTGIQALDLLGRKVLGDGGQNLQRLAELIIKDCAPRRERPELADMVDQLGALMQELGELTQQIGGRAGKDPDEVGAAAVDYLMFCGYVVLAWFWVQMADVALQKLESGVEDDGFYRAKLQTARFYFERILPRTLTHAAVLRSGAQNVMEMSADDFYFG